MGREGTVNRELRVDPPEKVTFEQTLNLGQLTMLTPGGTAFAKAIRWKYALHLGGSTRKMDRLEREGWRHGEQAEGKR